MYFLFVFIGACFASFSFHFAERRRKNISQFKYSHCLYCDTPIPPIYLIPIIGYLFSYGYCKSCHAPIPKVLPYLESIGALVGFLLCHQSISPLHPMTQLLIATVLLLMSLDDYYTQWIRDSDLICYGILIIFDILVFNSLFWSERIVGAFIVTIPLFLIYYCFPHALGSGDIIFISLSGFYLGIIYITYAFCIGIFAALIYSIWLMIRHKATKESSIPLIPFLSIGVLCMMLI